MIRNQPQTQKAKGDQGHRRHLLRRHHPKETRGEAFFGCVADLLSTIHGINKYSFIQPGRRERKEKKCPVSQVT